MAKTSDRKAAAPAGKTGRPGPGERRPLPSLREHWTDLRARPAALLVIARNLVPVVGVYAFGWSRSLVIFDFWFDGLMGMVAILTVLIPVGVRETFDKGDGLLKRTVATGVAWPVVVAFLCLPYWILFIPLHDYLLDPEMWRQIRESPGLWAIFAGIAVTQMVTAFRRGYPKLAEREMKQALRWDTYLLILRAMAMFVLMAPVPTILVVPVLVLIASYLEIWPANALGLFWGDPTRLHEDPPPG